MNAIIANGTPTEIAALALAVQKRQFPCDVRLEIDGKDIAKAVFETERNISEAQ